VGILSIAMEYMCFDPNKGKSFEEERRALHDAKLTNFNKSSEALAHIWALHQAATTAFGSEFMTYYDLFGLTQSKLSKEIQFEIDEITAKSNTTDAMNCDWEYIEDIVTTAWGTFSRRPHGYHAKIAGIDPTTPSAQIDQPKGFTAHNATLRRESPEVSATQRGWHTMQQRIYLDETSANAPQSNGMDCDSEILHGA
jgi:hypothetical protein